MLFKWGVLGFRNGVLIFLLGVDMYLFYNSLFQHGFGFCLFNLNSQLHWSASLWLSIHKTATNNHKYDTKTSTLLILPARAGKVPKQCNHNHPVIIEPSVIGAFVIVNNQSKTAWNKKEQIYSGIQIKPDWLEDNFTSWFQRSLNRRGYPEAVKIWTSKGCSPTAATS